MKTLPISLRILCFSVLAAFLTGIDSILDWQSALVVIAQFSMVITLAYVSMGLGWSFRSRFLAVFFIVFNIMFLNIVLELIFFTEFSSLEYSFVAAGGLLASAVGATAIVWAFPPHELTSSIRERVTVYFKDFQQHKLVTRFIAAVAFYSAVYFLIGYIAFQFTQPYYEPGNSLGLTVPKLSTVMILQVLRSIIYVCSILLFILGSNYSRQMNALLCAALLFVFGGLAPLILNTDWPNSLRLYHGIEIFLQNGSAGYFIGWILSTQSSNQNAQIQTTKGMQAE